MGGGGGGGGVVLQSCPPPLSIRVILVSANSIQGLRFVANMDIHNPWYQ